MQKTVIHTDGSSRGNPGPGGWAAIIERGEEIKEIGGRSDKTTNNRMEMTAALEALSPLPLGSVIEIYSDSEYLLNGITKWVYGWQANGWKTKEKKEVLNRDLWQLLMDEVAKREVSWKKVVGHSGHSLNDRCDEIATSFADGKNIALYAGSKSGYEIKESKSSDKEKSPRSKKAGKAYSYISKVEDVIDVHKSWAECEARVKNVKGARYRKALSPEEEKEIISLFQKS